MKASGKVIRIHRQCYGFVFICLRNIFLFAGQTEALERAPSILPYPTLLLFLSLNNHLEQGHFDLLSQ